MCWMLGRALLIWLLFRYRNENELLERVNDPDKYYVEVIMPDKLRINLEYVARHSFTFDIRLIFQTFRAIVSK